MQEATATAATDSAPIALPAARLGDPGAPIALPAAHLGDERAAIALPAERLTPENPWIAKPSAEAAVTVVPEEAVDDALDDAMGAAFDAVFSPRADAAPFEPGDPALDLAQACAALALDKKAENVVVLRVAELTSYADYFVIAAAPSERQVQAIARNVTDELKKRGRIPMSTDGIEQGNWVIVDYGSVVLHVFLTSARTYYDLDGFWGDAPRVDVDEPRGKAVLAHFA